MPSFKFMIGEKRIFMRAWFGISLVLIFTFAMGSSESSAQKKESPTAKMDLTTAIADVAEKVMPAVVNIEITQRVSVPTPVFPFENDPFFRYFFGQAEPRRYKKEMRGIGTGMIIDGEGHILTNNHVVSGAQKIMVKMVTGEEFEAKLVGADPKTDLAIIRIKPFTIIPYLTFGNSDKLRVGEWVVAIGSPRGLEQTVTAGIISAKHRTGILDPSSYQDYIQTDVAINPGNSGGPLLNLAGEVIGVNAAIISESGGFEGIGFAIPSNMAAPIADSLIKAGKVVRGWIGLNVQEVPASLTKRLNWKGAKGAFVTEVMKGGPAEKAGIQKGDIIVTLDGTTIESVNDFRNRIATAKVMKKIEVGLFRKGERMSVHPVVAAYKSTPALAAEELGGKLGIKVKEISVLEARKMRLPSRQGVILSEVDAFGPAGRAGLEPGDIIFQINNRAVRGLNDYNRILEQTQKEDELLLLVRDSRSGETGYLTLVSQ